MSDDEAPESASSSFNKDNQQQPQRAAHLKRPHAAQVEKVKQQLQKMTAQRVKKSDKKHMVSQEKRFSFTQRIQQVDTDIIHDIEQVSSHKDGIQESDTLTSQFREQVLHWHTRNVTVRLHNFVAVMKQMMH